MNLENVFQADEILIQYLLSIGLIESTSIKDSKKGKREFRSSNGRRRIKIDVGYSLELISGFNVLYSGSFVNRETLDNFLKGV